jgi:hypothetical protein
MSGWWGWGLGGEDVGDWDGMSSEWADTVECDDGILFALAKIFPDRVQLYLVQRAVVVVAETADSLSRIAPLVVRAPVETEPA